MCKKLNIEEENIKSLVLARILEGDLGTEEIKKLAHLSFTNKEQFIRTLNNTSFTNLYLTQGTKFIPGRTIKLGDTFPWLFPETKEEK